MELDKFDIKNVISLNIVVGIWLMIICYLAKISQKRYKYHWFQYYNSYFEHLSVSENGTRPAKMAWCLARAMCVIIELISVNSLRSRQNRRHFADDVFKCNFLNENVWIPIKISLKFVPKGPINNIPALVEIMAWRRPGDKPLSQPMMVSLPTHICVTRPQWVNKI